MVAVCQQLMALPFIPVADENQVYTFIDQVRVQVAEMKCAERLAGAGRNVKAIRNSLYGGD